MNVSPNSHKPSKKYNKYANNLDSFGNHIIMMNKVFEQNIHFSSIIIKKRKFTKNAIMIL